MTDDLSPGELAELHEVCREFHEYPWSAMIRKAIHQIHRVTAERDALRHERDFLEEQLKKFD